MRVNMKCILYISTTLWLFASGVASTSANDLSQLLDQVAALNISREGYVLGKALTDEQKKIALRYPQKIDNPQLFKFKDGQLSIVGLEKTDRIIIMYEDYDGVSSKEIKDLVGNLFLDFGKPTVFNHDKVIYWAWHRDGVISADDFKDAKKRRAPLNILATVKLNSSVEIMSPKQNKGTGNVYYIVSSDPVLKRIKK